jgi:hypothetical protein
MPQIWTIVAEIDDSTKSLGYDQPADRFGFGASSLVVQVSGGALTRSSSVTPGK